MKAFFEILGLTKKEISRLAEAFAKADDDGSGALALEEFTKYIGVEHSKFAERVFGIMDIDQSGFIDFFEFVVAVWHYATLSTEELSRFSLSIYDTDGDGMFSRTEITRMFCEVCGDSFARSEKAQFLIQCVEEVALRHNVDGHITMKLYSEFASAHPALLMSVFHTQTQMKKRILDEKTWASIEDRRNEKFAGSGDGGWRVVKAELMTLKAAEAEARQLGTKATAVAARKTRGGISKETRVVMEKREEYLNRKAGRLRATMPGVDGNSEYFMRFKKTKNAYLDTHEVLEDWLEARPVFEIPERYTESAEITKCARDLAPRQLKREQRKELNELLGFTDRIAAHDVMSVMGSGGGGGGGGGDDNGGGGGASIPVYRNMQDANDNNSGSDNDWSDNSGSDKSGSDSDENDEEKEIPLLQDNEPALAPTVDLSPG